jgi:uncharacterized protein YjbI with pentapeptide repeats
VGIDEIPLTYPHTETDTICWKYDNSDAMDYMVLSDSQGKDVLRVDANGDCVTDTIEPGDYVMELHHDESMCDPLPIFIIPNPDQNQQTMKTDGLFNGFKVVVVRILSGIQNAMIKGANAQSINTSGSRRTLIDTNSCIGCDLSGVNLQYRNLSGADLSGANLYRAYLNHANLFGASLLEADMESASMISANLTKANMFLAKLTHADIHGAVLVEAVIARATLDRANLNGANLSEAVLVRADLGSAELYAAILSSTDMLDANLNDANLSFADLSGADLRGAILSFGNLNRANLSGADLNGAIWCDGCICADQSIGNCNGCASVDICTGM